VWQQFMQIRKMPLLERKIAFLKIKKDFYDYVISVPQKYVPEQEYKDTNIVYISNEQVDLCYDNETGWKRDNETFMLL
jgi:CRISPR-associated endonuclease/helicase Cas3